MIYFLVTEDTIYLIIHTREKKQSDRASNQHRMKLRFLALTDFASQYCGERCGLKQDQVPWY
ncbi:hypothetical protein [Xenorhabdus bovienii]|uniref:hypothetical protein n=1 Tax=Xenorhabdus bovienii TaxID=40576 RepID=UPI0012D2E92B|nr:hypothetical protein [Xenorhabdus bovienii]